MAAHNHDMLAGFKMIFVTLSQTYMDKLVDDPTSELLQVMLKLLHASGGSYSEVCGFWKGLYGELNRIEKPEIRTAKLEQFLNVSGQVLMVCVDRMQLEDDVYTALNAAHESDEEFEDAMDHRYHYGKVLKYLGACYGVRTLWPVLAPRLKADIEGLTANPTLVRPWVLLETVLSSLGDFLVCTLSH